MLKFDHMTSSHGYINFEDSMEQSDETKPSESQNEAGVEPSIHSDIKEQRISARRKRVLMKIDADRRAAMGEKPQEVRQII